jgi:hypothetical protein
VKKVGENKGEEKKRSKQTKYWLGVGNKKKKARNTIKKGSIMVRRYAFFFWWDGVAQ